MSAIKSTTSPRVFIYVLQRISDKAFLYIGSSINPSKRFAAHRRLNPYPVVRSAFQNSDLRFLIVAETNEAKRIETEYCFWKAFLEAGHPICNINPAYTTWEYNKPSANKGRVFSAEHRQRISEAMKGKTFSHEHRQKLSAWQKGKPKGPPSEEHRQNLSKAKKGKKQSEEHKRKLSAIRKGKVPWNKGKSIKKERKDDPR